MIVRAAIQARDERDKLIRNKVTLQYNARKEHARRDKAESQRQKVHGGVEHEKLGQPQTTKTSARL